MSNKVKWAKMSIVSNTSLIIMKIVVGTLSGSVSIVSEGIHSTMDLLAAMIAYISVKISSKPADEDHQYGHGKIENVSGVIEALLIFLASFMIMYEAVKKIFHPEEIKSIYLGIIVMLVSAMINLIVSRKLYKVAKEEESIALEADALHLKADVLTSLGVAIGLIIILITKMYILDSVVAIGVALFILKEAYQLLMKAFEPLMDISLSHEEINAINKEVERYYGQICKIENLRTRQGGGIKYVDFKLIVSQDRSIKEAHDICDKIEDGIENKLKKTSIMIHIEGCTNSCNDCKLKDGHINN